VRCSLSSASASARGSERYGSWSQNTVLQPPRAAARSHSGSPGNAAGSQGTAADEWRVRTQPRAGEHSLYRRSV
jgi:hypothetical protein